MKHSCSLAKIGLVLSLFVISIPCRAIENISEVCDAAGDEAAGSFAAIYPTVTFPSSIFKSGTPEDVLSALQGFCVQTADPGCLADAPWILFNSSRLEVSEGSFLAMQSLAQRFLQLTQFSGATIDGVLKQAASAPASYTSATTVAVESVIAGAKANPNDSFRPSGANGFFLALDCATYGDLGCDSALNDELQIGKVGLIFESIDGDDMAANLTAMSAVQDLFSNPIYSQGLAIAAEIILQRLHDAQSGILPTAHFLDDLEEGYRQAGFDSEQATEMAFTYLAFYGARGASVEYVSSLATRENYPVFVSSYVISGALGALDAYTRGSGSPYSLPASVSTTCLYGRPYHFWMAAYFARELVKQGHSPESAVIATHMTGLGYEIFAETITRIPFEVMTVPYNDPLANSSRINIAMNDSGARFGAEQALPPIRRKAGIDVDQRLSSLFASEGKLKPLSYDDAFSLFDKHLFEYLMRWEELFRPNSGFSKN